MNNACNYPWRDATPPNLETGRTTGSLRGCDYCGSMHPTDLAEAIKAGATLDPADRKYGWPHKFYVNNVPNPHAGLLESRMSSSHAHPVCPKTERACEHKHLQSFSHPGCECMRDAPETVNFGNDTDGRVLVAAPTGSFSSRTGKPEFSWRAPGQPASETTWGKFYSVHLKDASDDERETIERAMGLRITFGDGGRVSWGPL